ncbi:MAG: hypothetical protein CM15mP45_12350 [Deltaproteobacteria bacterium]|nr:MAG: hypothetical protein CM15mP45_12350 [Deltaproteobacteria bacterium]
MNFGLRQFDIFPPGAAGSAGKTRNPRSENKKQKSPSLGREMRGIPFFPLSEYLGEWGEKGVSGKNLSRGRMVRGLTRMEPFRPGSISVGQTRLQIDIEEDQVDDFMERFSLKPSVQEVEILSFKKRDRTDQETDTLVYPSLGGRGGSDDFEFLEFGLWHDPVDPATFS